MNRQCRLAEFGFGKQASKEVPTALPAPDPPTTPPAREPTEDTPKSSEKASSNDASNVLSAELGDSGSDKLEEVEVSSLASNSNFGIIVVVGPSGSGKTSHLRALAAHFGIAEACNEEWGRKQAVVSHPAFIRKESQERMGLDLLGCVGLNRVPAWVRPYHVLSNGEGCRAQLALALARAEGKGILIDDFATTVDNQNAASMSCSLRKLVQKGQVGRVLLATTKTTILPYLAPDYVLFTKRCASPGPCCKIIPNPWPRSARFVRPALLGLDDLVWTCRGENEDVKSGWRSCSGALPDTDPTVRTRTSLEDGSGPRRTARYLLDASESYVRTCEVDCDEACEDVAKAFDFDLEWRQPLHAIKLGALPCSYVLGACVGPSGSGKSSALAHLCGGSLPEALSWDADLPVKSQIESESEEDLQELLNAVMLPESCWARPYSCLSRSQQAAADAARLLAAQEGCTPVCLDEFTSTTDRTKARRMCHGLATLARRRRLAGRNFGPVVVATVHLDILQWLLPDWVFFAGEGKVVRYDGPEPTEADVDEACRVGKKLEPQLSQTDGDDLIAVKELLKPQVPTLTIRHLADSRASRAVFHEVFEEHHYMKGELPTAFYGVLVRCGATPVAFQALAQQFGVGQGTRTLRESRLVVLPEWQGFGLGPKLSDGIGDRLMASNMRFYSKTHHPRLGEYRQHSSKWKPTVYNLQPDRGKGIGSTIKARRRSRCLNRQGEEETAPKKKRGRPPKQQLVADEIAELGEQDKSSELVAKDRARRPYCHQFIGTTVDGNDHMVAETRKSSRAAAPTSEAEATPKKLKTLHVTNGSEKDSPVPTCVETEGAVAREAAGNSSGSLLAHATSRPSDVNVVPSSSRQADNLAHIRTSNEEAKVQAIQEFITQEGGHAKLWSVYGKFHVTKSFIETHFRIFGHNVVPARPRWRRGCFVAASKEDPAGDTQQTK